MEAKMLTSERHTDKETGCRYRYVFSDTEYFTLHYHDYYEIFFMLSGNAVHCIGDKKIKLTPKSMIFVRPHDVHDYIACDKKGFQMLNIAFNAETAEEIFAFLGSGFPSKSLIESELPPSVILSDSDFDWVTARMDKICAIDPDDYESLKTALRILLMRLFTKHFSDYEEREDAMPPWFSKLCEQLKESANFVYGTERLMSLTDKSREHVARCFKKYTGKTATEYINELRLNFIAGMLKNSNYKITDIIFESGFNNISWACLLFKQKFGVSMRDFRNS